MPHDGPDSLDNMLCPCPNRHVLFDLGSVAAAEDLSLIGEEGRLEVHPRRSTSAEHLRYRLEHYRTDP